MSSMVCECKLFTECTLMVGNIRRTFRADFTTVGLLCVYFPKIAICGLSATVPTHIRGFIYRTLRFPKFCILVQRSIDRPNIFLICLEIKSALKSRDYLDFKVLKGLTDERRIPKTMVFCDSLTETYNITTHLSNLLPTDVY